MNLAWMGLGLVVWALGITFALILMRMAGDQDRQARHEEEKAFAEARTLAECGFSSADLFDLVQHGRELQDIALEVLMAARARGLAKKIGNGNSELEALLAEQRPPGPLH